MVEEASPIYLLRLHAVTYETPNSILRLDEMPNPDASLSEVLALEHESRIIGQWSNPVQYKSVITLSDKAQNWFKHGYYAYNWL